MAAQTDSENQNLEDMEELKVGERITIECVETSSPKCTGCIFYKDEWADCPTTIFQCGRDTEFKQVQVHTFTDEELENLKADVRKETLNQVKLLVHWPNVKDAIAEFESLMEETK